MEEAERRAAPLALASWLEGPWSAYTATTRRGVLLYALSLLVAHSFAQFLTSDTFVSYLLEQSLSTPLLHSAMGTALANAAASAAWYTPLTRPDASLLAMWRVHGGTISFIALSTFGTIGLAHAATDVMSSTSTTMIRLWLPLIMPFTAVCFERERDGAARQYGLWPCLCLGRSSVHAAIDSLYVQPWWGVLPGVFLIVVACEVSVGRLGQLTNAIGFACAR